MNNELIDHIKSDNNKTPLMKLIALGIVVYALIISSVYVFQFTFSQIIVFSQMPSIVAFSFIEISMLVFTGLFTYYILKSFDNKDLMDWTIMRNQLVYIVLASVLVFALSKLTPIFLPNLLFGDSQYEINKYYSETSTSDIFNIIESIDYYLKITLIFVISFMKK